MIEVRTQAEADAVIVADETDIRVYGNVRLVIPNQNLGDSSQPRIEVLESSQPRIEVYGSSQPTIEVCDSSQPRIEVYDSSQPRIEVLGSSQPRIEVSDSSQPRIVVHDFSHPRIEVYGFSQPRIVVCDSSQPRIVVHGSSQPTIEVCGSSQPRIEVCGSSQPRIEVSGSSSHTRVNARAWAMLGIAGSRIRVTATSQVRIRIDHGEPEVEGGKVYYTDRPQTAAEWCEIYGTRVEDGVATLYKAVNNEYQSLWEFAYVPGTIPKALDWDGAERECGGGLHFCATPAVAHSYNREATRYVACPVALADIVVVKNPRYPDKIKAKGCCGPIWECDEDGEPMA